MQEQQRRLVAILFADIVGYTALMEKQEEETLVLLNRFKSEIENNISVFQGEIIQYYGDACLLIFENTIHAVRFAQKIQASFQNGELVPVRVGIHSGEVVFREDNIFGNAVNIASRVESIGVAGSILLTRRVQQKIQYQDDIKTISLGDFHFKNVAKPMEIFALNTGGLKIPKREKIEGKLKNVKSSITKLPLALGIVGLAILLSFFVQKQWFLSKGSATSLTSLTGPSIAVLPFTLLSKDEDAAYFGEGFLEDILTHLYKIEELRVISRTSSMHYEETDKTIPEIARELGVEYIVEGMIRKQGEQLRINANLVRASSGEVLWDDSFDRQVKDIFKIQSEVAQSIAEALKFKITPQVITQMEEPPTSNMQAYNLFVEGRHFIKSRKKRGPVAGHRKI